MRLPTIPLALAGLLLFAGPALAQMPNPAEIKKKIDEGFKKLVDEAEVVKLTWGEDDAITINYKKIPTDPKVIAKSLGRDIGGGRIPEKQIEQYMGMYMPMIQEMLNKHLADVGELINKKVIKIRSKKIYPGKHRIGIVFSGEKIAGVIVFDKKGHAEKDQKKMKKPILIKLKTKSTPIKANLVLKIKEPKKKKKGKIEFDLYVDALRYAAKSKKPLILGD
ncbi:MAG: hypothetical protein JKY65_21175 [Planctomycetes bacterium]|nr:hypothetical protein [Planctomycetota bacterium]